MKTKKVLALLLACFMVFPCFITGTSAEDTAKPFVLNGTGYATLSAAVAKANDGDTITMVSDATISAIDNIDKPTASKKIIVDGNHHTIAGRDRAGALYGVGSDKEDYKLDITFKNVTLVNYTAEGYVFTLRKNVKVTLGEGATLIYATETVTSVDKEAVLVNEGAEFILNGGYLKNGGNKDSNKYINAFVYLYAKNATFTYIDGQIDNSGYIVYALYSTCVINLHRIGVIDNRYKIYCAQDNTPVNFLFGDNYDGPSSAKVMKNTPANNDYSGTAKGWGNAEYMPVLVVGEKTYDTWADAVDKVEDGGTIHVLRLPVGCKDTWNFDSVNKTFSIDGHGAIWNPSANLVLEQKDSSATDAYKGYVLIGENADVTLKNVTIQERTGTSAVYANALIGVKGKLTLGEGVLVKTTSASTLNAHYSAILFVRNGSLTLNGGVIETQAPAIASLGFAPTITINSGSITSNKRAFGIRTEYEHGHVEGGVMVDHSEENVQIVINGGTITSKGSELCHFFGTKHFSVTQNGGSIKCSSGAIMNCDTSVVADPATQFIYTAGDVTEAGKTNKDIARSLSLKGDINLNIYFTRVRNATSDITINGASAELAETITSGRILASYCATVPMAAKQMKDFVVVHTNDRDEDLSVNVEGYALETFDDDDASDELKVLLRAMLVYGRNSQLHFDYQTSALVGDGIDLDLSDASVTEEMRGSVSGSSENISYYGASLLLESTTTIRHYFKLASGKNIGDCHFMLGLEELTPVRYAKDSAYWYVDISNIAAQDLDKVFALEVDGITVCYSALSYAYSVLNGVDEEETLVNTIKAMILYNSAADNYFQKKTF